MSKKPPDPDANGDPVAPQTPVDEAAPEPHQSPDDAEPDDRPTMPCHVIRFGLVRACIWRNVGNNGEVGYIVSFNRFVRMFNHETNQHEWQVGYSYGLRELPLVEMCAAAALEWVSAALANEPLF